MANKKISELPFLGSTGYTSSDIMPIVTYYSAVTGTTVHTPISDFASYILNATPVNYSDLLLLILNNNLVQGSYYLINDFRTCYDQPDFDYTNTPIINNNYKQGPIEPIMVLATSNNTISEVAYQPTYPNDRIRYDISFSTTEATGGAAFGRIKERIDEYNNRTDYDHRNILFKRYQMYVPLIDLPINGTVEILSDGTINGTGTLFTDLTVGDVIYCETLGTQFYEIISISNDTTMTVSGDTIISVPSSSLIYRTLLGSNGLNQYFSHKRMNVKSDDYEEYTTFGNSLSTGNALNNFIGNFSNNYQNLNGGVFLLSNNIINNFFSSSNIFADYAFNNTFGGVTTYSNSFDTLCRENISTQSMSENVFADNFNKNFFNCNITRNFAKSYFQENIFLCGNLGVIQYNTFGNGCFSNIIYTVLQSNYILDDFRRNTIGDFGNIGNFIFSNNKISNGFNLNIIKNNFRKNSILNNFFNNKIDSTFDFNEISDGFLNNRNGNAFQYNVINNSFSGNYIEDNFFKNKISDDFQENITNNNFIYNTIGSYFYFNMPKNIGDWGFYDLTNISTRTYNNFNTATGSLSEDVIVGKEFFVRVISTGQYFKLIFKQWTVGTSGGGFQYERTEYDNSGSPIGPTIIFTKRNFENDVDIIIPGVLEISRGTSDGIYNSATEVSWNPALSPDDTEWNSIYTVANNDSIFSNNKIGDNFTNNKIGGNFGNILGVPLGNNIGDFVTYNDFGYEFTSNIIGNEFGNNSIGNTFKSNFIFPNFIGNTVLDSFTLNTTQSTVAGIDFSSATHVYNNYSCTLFYNSLSNLKLSYINGANALVVVNANS